MAITTADLTEASISGIGVFDVLMRAARAHLDSEFSKNRIKGPEYAQVYLGSFTSVLETATKFLLEKDRIEKELLLLQAQIDKLVAEKAVAEQQVLNLTAEKLNIEARTSLVAQQTLNAVTEGANLVKQGCVLDAQFDLLVEQKSRTVQETGLMAQKILTERAQTQATGVDSDSVIGKQKALYGAQTDGFSRNAEQQAAKILIDTWNVRRTTDEGTVADGTNKLQDASIGAIVTKLAAGVGVTV